MTKKLIWPIREVIGLWGWAEANSFFLIKSLNQVRTFFAPQRDIDSSNSAIRDSKSSIRSL
jgi:hypothetical protein